MPDYPLGQLPGPNTEIYNQLGPDKPSSPLGMANEFMQLQQRGLANAQVEQQLKARAAMGPILQQSVGPDGQIDWNKAVVGMAAHPETAWMAGDVMNQAVQRKLTEAQTMKATLETAQARYKAIGDSSAGLLAKGVNVNQGDLAQSVAGLINSGVLTPAEGKSYMAHAAQFGNGQNLHQHLTHMALTAQGATEAFKSLYGSINPVQLGGRTAMVQTIPRLGFSGETGSLGHTPTPGEYYAPKAAKDPWGGEKLVPAGPSLGMPTPGGQLPTAPAPGITTANPKEYETFLEGKGSLAEYEKKLKESVSSGNVALQAIDEAAELLKTVRTGGGESIRASLGQKLQALGVDKDMINRVVGGTGTNNLADIQALVKLLTRQAVQTLSIDMEGNRKTEGEMMRYIDQASPNINMDPEAIAKIQAFNKELYRQKLVELQQFYNYRFMPGKDGKPGTEPRSEFMQNPNSWNQVWSEGLQRHYQGKAKYHELKQLEQDALKALRGVK